MSLKKETLSRMGITVSLWLLKGLCIGFGIFVAWRACRAI